MAQALRLRGALDLLISRLADCSSIGSRHRSGATPSADIGLHHLQPAEPTTTGYRLAQYAQDLLTDYRELQRGRDGVRGKGLKSAVSTSTYTQLLQGTGMAAEALSTSWRGRARGWPVATQIYPRKQDYGVLSALAELGQSLYKFAFDLRILQSPPIGEWAEPFARAVGSSAMPFKRNPHPCGGHRRPGSLLCTFPRGVQDNARAQPAGAHARRLGQPADDAGAFLAAGRAGALRVAADRGTAGRPAASERLLAGNVCRDGAPADGAGATAQTGRRCMKSSAASMAAWAAVQGGGSNPWRTPLRRSLSGPLRRPRRAARLAEARRTTQSDAAQRRFAAGGAIRKTLATFHAS